MYQRPDREVVIKIERLGDLEQFGQFVFIQRLSVVYSSLAVSSIASS